MKRNQPAFIGAVVKKQIRVRVAGVISERGKVLLVCHERDKQRYWVLPGGGVEYGETMEEALIREFQEEVGLTVKVKQLLLINESIAPDGTRHGIQFTFLVKKTGGKLSVTQDFRLRDAKFFPWADLPSLDFRPPLIQPLMRAYKEKFSGPSQFIANLWR